MLRNYTLYLCFVLVMLFSPLLAAVTKEATADFRWERDGTDEKKLTITIADASYTLAFNDPNQRTEFIRQLKCFGKFTLPTRDLYVSNSDLLNIVRCLYKLLDGTLIELAVVDSKFTMTCTRGKIPLKKTLTSKSNPLTGDLRTEIAVVGSTKVSLSSGLGENVILASGPLREMVSIPKGSGKGVYKVQYGLETYLVRFDIGSFSYYSRVMSSGNWARPVLGVLATGVIVGFVSAVFIYVAGMTLSSFDPNGYEYSVRSSFVLEQVPFLKKLIPSVEADDDPTVTSPEASDDDYKDDENDEDDEFQGRQYRDKHSKKGPQSQNVRLETEPTDVDGGAASVAVTAAFILPLLLL